MAETPPASPICDTSTQLQVDEHLRSMNMAPEAIDVALRRIVHDYVAGWGIVLTQSPRERRRKKRIWNRRSAERHAFRRPVWVHKAHWAAKGIDPHTRPVIMHLQNTMYLVSDISATGIGLTCDRAPKSRLVVLSFDSWKGVPVEIVVYLRWRRKAGTADYRCGGSILGVLTPQV